MLLAVFRAEINNLDEEYFTTARRMRELAINEYGCREFIACTEGNIEIALSYWDDEDQIKEWKSNTEHVSAQQRGRTKWYRSYSVQITEILREYKTDA